MMLVPALRKDGFRLGQRILLRGGKYHVEADEAAETPPPLVYVIVDKNGESVKTGRSLRQTISQRHGSLARGMNGASTKGQNVKPVVISLKRETSALGPLLVYVKHCTSDAEASALEVHLFDVCRGRIDKRRG